MDVKRDVKERREYRVKLDKGQLDYAKMIKDEDVKDDLICPRCNQEKELIMTPYWGFGRTYYTCFFVCPSCDERR